LAEGLLENLKTLTYSEDRKKPDGRITDDTVEHIILTIMVELLISCFLIRFCFSDYGNYTPYSSIFKCLSLKKNDNFRKDEFHIPFGDMLNPLFLLI